MVKACSALQFLYPKYMWKIITKEELRGEWAQEELDGDEGGAGVIMYEIL